MINIFKIATSITILFLVLFLSGCTKSNTVNFFTDGGTFVESVEVTNGNAISEPFRPIKDGYTFLGWYSDSSYNVVFDFAQPVVGNLVLYAKWDINQYTIIFETNGGSALQTITDDYETDLTWIANPIKEGYLFVGWYIDEELTQEFIITNMPNESLTLYSKWQIEQISLTYIDIDGEVLETISYVYGTDLALINPIEYPIIDGYLFLGWFTDLELSNPFQFDSIQIENLILYAKYNQVISIEDLVTNPNNYLGLKLSITGIITSTVNGHPYIQQDGFGIYVYIGYEYTTKLAVGNEVTIKSLTLVFFPDQETGVLEMIGFERGNVVIVSAGNVITPIAKELKDITLLDLGSYLKIEGLEVVSIYTSANTGDHTVTCKDSLGNIIDVHVQSGVTRTEINSMFVIGRFVDVVAPLSRYMSIYQLEMDTLDGVTLIE